VCSIEAIEDSNAARTCRISVARACRKGRAWAGVCGVSVNVEKGVGMSLCEDDVEIG